MARKSSRKSSSGDEALLWGIAAVVVAIVGVGTAIMLTRPGKPAIGNKEKHKCTAGTKDGNKSTFTCSGGTQECVDDSSTYCNPVKPVQTATYCYRALRQGVGKDNEKYFVQRAENKNDGTCPQGWLAQSNAGLKAGTYTQIEVNNKNQCYNKYLMPTDYDPSKPGCLQAGDCDTTSFTTSACKTQWTPPSCLRGPGFSNCNVMSCSDATDSASCNVGTDDSGQACCVWGQEPPKPPAKKPPAKKPPAKKPPAKKPAAKKPAAKKPAAAKCCGGDGRCTTSYQDQVSCDGKGKYSFDNCYWDETGQCNTENFRMRRRRR